MSSPPSSPTLLDKLLFVLAPIRAAALSESYLRNATRALGWDLEAAGVDLPRTVENLRELASDFDTLMGFGSKPPEDLEGYLKLLTTSERIFNRLREFGELFEAAGDVDLSELGSDFLDAMVLSAWFRFAPISFAFANLLTLIDEGPEAAEISAGGRVIRYKRPTARLRLDRLGPLLRDPARMMREEYFAVDQLTDRDTAYRAADRLFPRIAFLANQLGFGAHYGLPEEVTDDDQNLREDLNHALTIFGAPDDRTMFGASFALASEANARGLIVHPFGEISVQRNLDPWLITIEVSETVEGLLFGKHVEMSGGTALRLRGRAELINSEDHLSTFGGTSGSGLQLGAMRIEAELSVAGTDVDAAIALSFDHVRLRLASGDGDGFLAKVLPADGLNADVPLAISWSNRKGFHFSGSAGLEASLPLNTRLGPVRLDAVNLGIATKDGQLGAQVSLSAGLSLGPLTIQIDRVGLQAQIDFPEKGANLGIANVELSFKPPNGIGLGINAASVSGAGMLYIDSAKGQYAGFIQLTIQEFLTVTAIGIITTKLPNGASGFSLVVMITAEGFKPIPLGLGFTLAAIGGLFALNRTCDEEFLREGIKNQTLNSLLFPKDPIRNATQIFGTLNNAFPPRSGSHFFGPVVRICWGTPPVLTMDLALILEIGKRRRLIILGRVSAIMPTEKKDLVRLQMNALGIIDFDQNSISLDATLFDSRLAGKFPITGQMAMRLNWGSSPMFALSIGGFHPVFKPPPNFPVLQRLAISFSNSSDFRLRAECYFAITSNSYQFGAKVELFAKAGGFSIEGRLGYDVLIQFDPFMFVASFYASVQLKRGSHNLFKVKVEGELSGPRPLHVKGKATFEIFWWDFSVSFDRTLVEGERPPKLEPIDVTEQLLAALNENQNWSAQLPEGVRRLVTLREPKKSEAIVVHPLGRLGVKQNVVPFDFDISRFGNTTPAGARRFEISSFTVTGKEARFDKVKDFFAPSQFIEMSDEEKLTAPSFDLMNAGVSAGVMRSVFSKNEDDILETTIAYETIIVDGQPKETGKTKPVTVAISEEFFNRHLSLGAAARSDLRRAGIAKYRSQVGKYSLGVRGWTIVSAEDGSPQGAAEFAAGTTGSYAEAFQAVQKLKTTNPARAKTLMLVRQAAKD